MSDEYEISSEIYSECDYRTDLTPTINGKNVISKFEFISPVDAPEVDLDGDYVVQRCPRKEKLSVEIEHSCSTVLDLVGLQVWRGAFLLADYMLHNRARLQKDKYVLELGSGVGLTSIIVSKYVPVVCTDMNKGDILKVIESNVERNGNVVNNRVQVLELDFNAVNLSVELESILPQVEVIMAADVVYDDCITEAFVRTLERLLTRMGNGCAYVALEKRFVFTVADCGVVAPCYDHFLKCTKLANLKMERLPLDFPQYFHYDRIKELVLWRISIH